MESNTTFSQKQPEVSGESLMNSRKDGLFIGELIGIIEEAYLHIPETEAEKRKRRSTIHNRFKLRNDQAIVETLSFLHNEGARSVYEILLPFVLSESDGQELAEKIRERFFGIELMVQQAYQLHLFLEFIGTNEHIRLDEHDLRRGILAWDMARLALTARMAFESGFIPENKMWEHIEYAGKQCREQFENNEEVGKSFLLGQAMEAGNANKLNLAAHLFLQKLKEKGEYGKE